MESGNYTTGVVFLAWLFLFYRVNTKGGSMKADVVIIGGGVTGCAIARALTKQKRKVLVLEKASDVCEGTSKANSGIVHAGYDAKPGTLKAKLNLEGNRMMPELAKELDFPFRQNGSLVLCFDEQDMPALKRLYDRGIENGVSPLSILSGDEVREMEPKVSKDVVGALYAPTGGIVCPFNLTIALAENAVQNGAEFLLNTDVTGVEKAETGYLIHAIRHQADDGSYDADGTKLEIEAAVVVNAAGVYADHFHNMVSAKKIHITARKGEYCLMDKKVGDYVSATLFQLPTALGKGVLVTPTVHGNLMVGPTAVDVEDKEENNTTQEGLADLLQRAALSVADLPGNRNIITSFAGLRAHEDGGDFVIGEPEDAPGFVDAAGIESPGLTCAPALGEYVAGLVQKILPAPDNADFIGTRKGIPNMAEASAEERKELIAANPLYANVICRCELVTEGEIIDAIRRPLGARTLDAVKRRTRAGMGRCQAGFCSPKTLEILARELGVDAGTITKAGGASGILTGFDKEDIE